MYLSAKGWAPDDINLGKSKPVVEKPANRFLAANFQGFKFLGFRSSRFQIHKISNVGRGEWPCGLCRIFKFYDLNFEKDLLPDGRTWITLEFIFFKFQTLQHYRTDWQQGGEHYLLEHIVVWYGSIMILYLLGESLWRPNLSWPFKGVRSLSALVEVGAVAPWILRSNEQDIKLQDAMLLEIV